MIDPDSFLHDDVLCFDHDASCHVLSIDFLEETRTFQLICIICLMLLALCFELFQHVSDFVETEQKDDQVRLCTITAQVLW